MLQNARVAAFIVSELTRENQQSGEGGGESPSLPSFRLGLSADKRKYLLFHRTSKTDDLPLLLLKLLINDDEVERVESKKFL